MSNRKLGFWLLTALVTGNMIGSGIFSLPETIANFTTPKALLFTWLFTLIGVMTIGHLFGQLVDFKPELTGGPAAYTMHLLGSKSKFSQIIGFNIAWGYWAARLPINTAILITSASYISSFIPITQNSKVIATLGFFELRFGNLIAFIVSSLILWFLHFVLISRGSYTTSKLNLIVAGATLIGFTLFLIVTFSIFQNLSLNPPSTNQVLNFGDINNLIGQVDKGVQHFILLFIGLETAIWLTGRVTKPSTIKWATLMGLLISLSIFIFMTAYTRETQILKSVPFSLLGVISTLGATIGWTLLSIDVPYQTSKVNLFPSWFNKENKNGAPYRAAWITNILTQVFLFSLLSDTLTRSLNNLVILATYTTLISFLFSALYSLKVVVSGENYQKSHPLKRLIDGGAAVTATFFVVWLLKAGIKDLNSLLLILFMFISGLFLIPFLSKR